MLGAVRLGVTVRNVPVLGTDRLGVNVLGVVVRGVNVRGWAVVPTVGACRACVGATCGPNVLDESDESGARVKLDRPVEVGEEPGLADITLSRLSRSVRRAD